MDSLTTFEKIVLFLFMMIYMPVFRFPPIPGFIRKIIKKLRRKSRLEFKKAKIEAKKQ